jgi:hypothetical protein
MGTQIQYHTYIAKGSGCEMRTPLTTPEQREQLHCFPISKPAQYQYSVTYAAAEERHEFSDTQEWWPVWVYKLFWVRKEAQAFIDLCYKLNLQVKDEIGRVPVDEYS